MRTYTHICPCHSFFIVTILANKSLLTLRVAHGATLETPGQIAPYAQPHVTFPFQGTVGAIFPHVTTTSTAQVLALALPALLTIIPIADVAMTLIWTAYAAFLLLATVTEVHFLLLVITAVGCLTTRAVLEEATVLETRTDDVPRRLPKSGIAYSAARP